MTRRHPGRAVLLALAAALLGALAAFALSGAGARAGGAPPADGPLAGYTTHVRATHYLGRRSYQADHYFKPLRPGVLQGLVVRHVRPDAPVVEVEWAIAKKVYDRLPRRAKRHWHPLAPAVDAGRVTIPGASEADAKAALADVRGLYAQTLNLAGIDGGLPTGPEGVRAVTHLAPGERGHGGHGG